MPCSPSDVSFPSPPPGPSLPGFGFSLNLPPINPFPAGFPEDLLALLNELQMLIPPGALKPQLNPNFGKDIFDAIMKLLDQFMPFLMLYKFFLPILELILCIIEVLCALMNPFKLIAALNRLFTQCIPAFLNLFPIFALIIMIISLLLLLLALIEYIINQILYLIELILKKIIALQTAFQQSDANGVLYIALELGALLCLFQNLFVLFAVFNIIIEIIKDILSLVFGIPPCQSGGSGDADSCCTPDVCPEIVQNVYTNTTGILKYFPQVSVSAGLPAPFASYGFSLRNEAWQLYDPDQTQAQAFSNIYNAFDVTTTPKPVFFPTDATYNAGTDPSQAPYQINLRLFYNPAQWGRIDPLGPRYIRFDNCIFSQVPTGDLIEGDNSQVSVPTGVGMLVGGLGYEDDNTTVLNGYLPDGLTPSDQQASLETFIHMPSETGANPVLNVNDGYTFDDIQYTFTPNIAPLLQKNIVTLGCIPAVSLNRDFVNTVIAGDVSLQTTLLTDLVNSPNFPNPNAAQECMTTAVSALRANLTVAGVAEFQATTTACLQNLQNATQAALGSMIGIGFSPCNSTFSLNPSLQFTTKPIVVSVNLNEVNGLPLTNTLPPSVASTVAQGIKGYPTFGAVSDFSYDGYSLFTALLTSPTPGDGELSVSYNNQMLCINTFPADTTVAPTHAIQTQSYQFVYAPVGGIIPTVGTGEGDTEGQPRRDAGDQARDGSEDS